MFLPCVLPVAPHTRVTLGVAVATLLHRWVSSSLRRLRGRVCSLLASRFVVVTRAPHRELPLPVSPGLATAQFVGQILAI